MLHGLENPDYTSGCQVASALLDCPSDGGEAETQADGLVVLVQNHRDMLEVHDELEA